MGLLAAKLMLAPSFVVAASVAGRRYGALAGGMIGGLPSVAGPVLLIFALTHGRAFAAEAATATVYGLVSLSVYIAVFAVLATRFRWYACMAIGWTAFLLATAVMTSLDAGAALGLVAACLSFVLVSAFMPRPADGAPPPDAPPRFDLPLRAVAAAALVVALTAAGGVLGAELSGLLTPFPVIASVLSAFAHAQGGPAHALRVLRGFVHGLYAFATFCFLVATLLPRTDIAVAFSTALAAAVCVQAIAFFTVTHFRRRRSRSGQDEGRTPPEVRPSLSDQSAVSPRG